MFQAKNCHIDLPTGTQDYIRFGRGTKTLVMIPGVGDGLKTVKGIYLMRTARAFAGCRIE